MTSIVIFKSMFYKKPNLLYPFVRHRIWALIKNMVCFNVDGGCSVVCACVFKLTFKRVANSTFKLLFIQLLRVQSSDGTKRVEILPNASLQELYESVELAFQMHGTTFALYRQRNYTNEVGWLTWLRDGFGARCAIVVSAKRDTERDASIFLPCVYIM